MDFLDYFRDFVSRMGQEKGERRGKRRIERIFTADPCVSNAILFHIVAGIYKHGLQI